MSKWYGIRATDVGTLSQSITQSWDEVQALAHDHKSSRVRHRMYRNFRAFPTEAEARAYCVQEAFVNPLSSFEPMGYWQKTIILMVAIPGLMFALHIAASHVINDFCDGSFWKASSPVCRSAHNIMLTIGAQQEYIIYGVCSAMIMGVWLMINTFVQNF